MACASQLAAVRAAEAAVEKAKKFPPKNPAAWQNYVNAIGALNTAKNKLLRCRLLDFISKVRF